MKLGTCRVIVSCWRGSADEMSAGAAGREMEMVQRGRFLQVTLRRFQRRLDYRKITAIEGVDYGFVIN